MFLPQEVIRRKRDGQHLSRDEIQQFIEGVSHGGVSEGQIAALAMAIYFQGLNRQERIVLTEAVRDSGTRLSWDREALGGPVVDKHSTGGVGDVVSLMLGPMVAACGGFVPMISGRGLGHTGGTLDKLDSIPGYQTHVGAHRFRDTVTRCGVAIVGQTEALAPADKRIYAIRDVTATVESIDLITASILGKKLAEGLDALVMDIKVGSGAFMPTYEASRQLAESMVSVANGAGVKTTALLTDMNQCLASSAGCAVEVYEAVRYLRGDYRNPRLHEVTLAQAVELLLSAGLATDQAQARDKLQQSLDTGQAAEVFGRMVAALGGPVDFMDNYSRHLPRAQIIRPVFAEQTGYLTTMDTRAMGMAVVHLGGGRAVPGDSIDPAVGLSEVASLGERLSQDRPLAMIHASSEALWQQAARSIRRAVSVDDQAPAPSPVVYQRITAD